MCFFLIIIAFISHTLEPIVGPKFWEDTRELMHLPPNIRVPTGRPKRKKNNKNEVSTNLTKMKETGIKVHCTYYKAAGHNNRSCEVMVIFFPYFTHEVQMHNNFNYLS